MQTLVTRTGEVREHQKARLQTSLPSQGGTRLSWEYLNAFSCKDPKQASLDSSLADGGRGHAGDPGGCGSLETPPTSRRLAVEPWS